jgi:CheY-like chemotaxis protein
MRSIHILLIEDNEGDILLTKEALLDGKVINEISVVRDGEEALDFLNKTGKYTDVEFPDLILLDVNLPKKNGHEVLQFVKTSEHIKHIPVIMLTTSSSQQDIKLSYSNHANCYITKPVEADNFMHVVAGIESFWISIVKLPSTN